METIQSVLNKSGLFEAIPEDQINKLLVCLGAEQTGFEKGQILWHAGDPVRSCALVLSGALRAEAINSSGEKTLIAYHTAGSLVGDVLMSTPDERSPVFVVAAEDAQVLFLPFHVIMGGCAQNCPCHIRLRENLVAEIAQKFWSQRRRIAYLSAKSLRARICMYLLDQSRQAGRPTFSLHCSREDLADLLGVNRSALSRELARMKQEKLLDYYRDTFRLLDPNALEQGL